MSKLTEFLGGGHTASPAMEIEIDAFCQFCQEYVDKAEYFALERLLKWTCQYGHISYIEDFRL